MPSTSLYSLPYSSYVATSSDGSLNFLRTDLTTVFGFLATDKLKATAGNKGLMKEAVTSVVDAMFLLVNIHFEDNEALSIASFINPRNVVKYTNYFLNLISACACNVCALFRAS